MSRRSVMFLGGLLCATVMWGLETVNVASAANPMPVLVYPKDQIISWTATDTDVIACYATGQMKIVDMLRSHSEGSTWKLGETTTPGIQLSVIPGTSMRLAAIQRDSGRATLRMYSVSDGKPLAAIELASTWVRAWGCSSDGKHFFYEDMALGRLYAVDLDSQKPSWQMDIIKPEEREMPVSVRPAFSFLPDGSGAIAITPAKIVARTVHGEEIWTRAAEPGGQWSVSLPFDSQGGSSTLAVDDKEHGRVVGISKKDGTNLWDFAAKDVGKLVALSNDGSKQAFVHNGRIEIHSEPAKSVVASEASDDKQEYRFSPNGRYLLALPILVTKHPAALHAAPSTRPAESEEAKRDSNIVKVMECSTGKLISSPDLSEESR